MPLHATLAMLSAAFTPMQVVSGDVRVQVLTPNLVRIEQKGPKGFEDRNTFTVVHRPTDFRHTSGDLDLGSYRVVVPLHASLTDIQILDKKGKVVFRYDGKPVPHSWLPGPSQQFETYVFADTPRLVPPSWGATPPPPENGSFKSNSGWDTTNDATDLYVFLNGSEGYQGLRRDFLELTGHTPMPPLAAFGFWDSRYYEYTGKEALAVIDEYRARGYPLDFFVVDTDWRVNGSHGYEINLKDFPDMSEFIRLAHQKHVGLMYNDHPEPVDKNALAPKEMEYRSQGLNKLLELGADVWWYDRNWMTHLHEPMPGIAKEVWGARIFQDVTQKARPDRRPMIMSNVDGIDNGIRHHAPHPAFHRFPIWWTGDTGAYFSYLQNGIANGVDSGVLSLLPYVNEDLGGHWAHPTPELYVRYLQYGTLSPITRIHCTKGEDRHPWIFGEEAEAIVKDYIKLRYRLMPTIYAGARRSYEDGTPLMRRCDIEWPSYPEAADNQQFMLGDDILVAPTNTSVVPPAAAVPPKMFGSGLRGEYFNNTDLKGKPRVTRIDRKIDFDWQRHSPVQGIPKENFSVRWTGKLGPVPETGEYHLEVRSDDGCRLFLDGKPLIDDWTGHAEVITTVKVNLQAGRTYDFRLEYLQLTYDDSCHFEWVLPSAVKQVAVRNLWVPPGEWEDVWNGQIVKGPQKISQTSPLRHTAMFVRRGGIVLQAPEMNYTGQKPWDPVTADLYPSAGASQTRQLYEDDGDSNQYQQDSYRKTELTLSRKGSDVSLVVEAAKGDYKGALAEREWVLRLHLLATESVARVMLDGNALKPEDYRTLAPTAGPVAMPFLGPASPPPSGAGSVIEIRVPRSSVTERHELRVALRE
jgi:hypothetical protein